MVTRVTSETLLTVPQVAERLSLKASTVRRMVFERRIDVIRVSRRSVRIPEAAITKILERGYRPAVEPR